MPGYSAPPAPPGNTPIAVRPTGPARPQPITHAAPPGPRAPKPVYQTKITPPRTQPQAASGPRGHWAPVGDKWVLIHAVGQNKWAQGGVAGHRAPPKPVGQTPLPNNPLAPLTQNQIQRTATNTVTKAYGGDVTDINDQAQQAQSLYATQQADDHAFSNWLVQQTANLNNSVSGTNQKLSDMVTGLRQSQATSLAALPGQAAAASGPGVSGTQPADALNRLTAPATTAANNGLAGEIATAAQQGVTNQLAAGQTGDIAQARVQATQNTELGNLNKALTTIAGERTKLVASRTGDIAKEIGRLQGVELSKRQFLINQADTEKAAGISQANTLNEIANRNLSTGIAQQNADTAAKNANTALTRAQNSDMLANANFKLNQQKFGAAQAKNMYEQEHGLGPYRASAPAGANKPLSAPQVNSIKRSVDQLQAALKYDISTYHSKEDPATALNMAYHDLQIPKNVQGDKYLGPLVGKGIDVGLLNAAFNSLGNGLTPGDIQYLQQTGTWNVGRSYRVATKRVGQAISGDNQH